MSDRSGNITMPCGTVHAARSVTGWSFDIEAIPRDRHIWAETVKGEVIKTRFIPKGGAVKESFWIAIGAEDRIIAWQPFIKPEASRMGRRLLVTKQSFDLELICDDVGSGA